MRPSIIDRLLHRVGLRQSTPKAGANVASQADIQAMLTARPELPAMTGREILASIARRQAEDHAVGMERESAAWRSKLRNDPRYG